MNDSPGFQSNLKSLSEIPNNFCLDGKDGSAMTNKEYLKQFAKGPCSPTVVLPGLMSTKLAVEIDCELFKNENSAVFKACGWTDCSKSFYEVIN